MLKYVPANNFTVFKDALSNRALKDYGALSKMLKQGSDYKEPQEPKVDITSWMMTNMVLTKQDIEDLKDYQKEIDGLITQYLSQ